MRLIDKDELKDWIVNEPSDIDNPDNALVNQYDGATFRQIEILGHIETMPEVTTVTPIKNGGGGYMEYGNGPGDEEYEVE